MLPYDTLTLRYDPKGMYMTTNSYGIQVITIPKAGYYSIDAYGAAGGRGRNDDRYRPGKGAHVAGTFKFEAGTRLFVAVGQNGEYCRRTSTSCDGSSGGGGGGGSFVWMGTTDIKATSTSSSNPAKLLLVAGGGGGASYNSYSEEYFGQDAQAHTSGGHSTRTERNKQCARGHCWVKSSSIRLSSSLSKAMLLLSKIMTDELCACNFSMRRHMTHIDIIR